MAAADRRRGYIPCRIGFAAFALTALLALASTAGSASGALGCGKFPIVGGVPPWGFHTGPSAGSYARGHGDISLSANAISGVLCQVLRVPGQGDLEITMTVKYHLVSHSHVAVMWGYPGNLIKFNVIVHRSTDPQCAVGTVGHVTLFGSYNGVRSDSVHFIFPAACADQDHLYHGPQVDNQVPPGAGGLGA
jgi:hypothetical protein